MIRFEDDLKIRLIEEALKARNSAYCPYSGYAVGAALLCGDSTIVTGANIENASYGATVCAERVAIFSAVYKGKSDFRAIAIAGGAVDGEIEDYAYPCGICRQVMREFADTNEFLVIVVKSKEDYVTCSLEELLPRSFGPEKLS